VKCTAKKKSLVDNQLSAQALGETKG